jgi:hypothetical protein
MANFGEIQTKFDSDPALCKRFLLDPVGVLAELGVVLAPQQAFQLQQDVMNFTRLPSIVGPHIHLPRPPRVQVIPVPYIA